MASKENLPSDTTRNEDSGGRRYRVKDDDSTNVSNCVDDMLKVSRVVDTN